MNQGSIVNTNRLEAFSDGVFAIAITLLVLEIKVPSFTEPLAFRLIRLWPSYLAYATSFIVIAAIWINHHAMFKSIVRSNASFFETHFICFSLLSSGQVRLIQASGFM